MDMRGTDVFHFLEPAEREAAPTRALYDALLQAKAGYFAHQRDHESGYPGAYQAVVWHLITELGHRQPEGRALLLEILQTPDSPLAFEVARVTVSFARPETHAALAALAKSRDMWAGNAGEVVGALERGGRIRLTDYFPDKPGSLKAFQLTHRRSQAAENADGVTMLTFGLADDGRPPGDHLAELITVHGLARLRAGIKGLSKQGFRLRCESDTLIPTGATKLGGWPDLPAGLACPRGDDGRPLTSVAQLKLSELGAPELPAAGMLYFFYDADRQPWDIARAPGAWRVLFHPHERELAEVRPDGPDDHQAFQACRLAVAPFLDFTFHWAFWASKTVPTEEEFERLEQLEESLAQLQRAPGVGIVHQVLGYPRLIQDGDPNGIDGRDRGDPYRLLLQVDSDRRTAMSWGDGGRLFYWIRQSDLKKRDFTRVIGSLESY